MKYKGSVWVEVLPQPKKTQLQIKAERVVKKAEKTHYLFNDLELAMFEALGRAEWKENQVSWLVLEQFDRLYAKFYP